MVKTDQKLIPAVLAIGLLFGLASSAPAETASGNKTGIGFRQGILTGTGAIPTSSGTQISLKHHLSGIHAVNPYAGFQLASGDGTSWGITLGSRFSFDVIQEKYLDFFGIGGVGLLLGSRETGNLEDETYFGLDVMGGIGTEFFLPDLPNLGFSFEAGMHFLFFHHGDSTIEIGTLGHVLTAGIHYYFR